MGRTKIPITLKIVTADNSPIIVERLQSIFKELGNVTFLGNECNSSDLLNLLYKHEPNIVILDIYIENATTDMSIKQQEFDSGYQGIYYTEAELTSGCFNLIRIIRKKYPKIIIMILTNFIELQYRINSIASGAHYFFDKSRDFEKIPEVLRNISPETISREP